MMKIGQIETTGEPGRRDAFHVPAVLVELKRDHLVDHHYVKGGARVRFTDDTFTTVDVCPVDQSPHGIVDPFIDKAYVTQLFWVLLWPSMIKDKLTHQFDLNIEDVPHKKTREEEDAEYEDQCKGCW